MPRAYRARCSTLPSRPTRTSETSSGGKRPCSTTPAVAERRDASTAGSPDRAQVVRDQPAVRARRHVAKLGGSDARERGADTVCEELERDRGADGLDELVGGDNDDEAIGGGRYDFLPRVRRSASLDHPAVGRDLVGAVHGDVEPLELVEGLDGQSELERARLASPREVATQRKRSPRAASAGRKNADRRARAEPDDHAVLDQLGRGFGRETLLLLDAHLSQRRIRAGCPPRPSSQGRSRSSRAAVAGSARGIALELARAGRARGRLGADEGASGGDGRRDRRDRDRGRRLRARRRRADGRSGGARSSARSTSSSTTQGSRSGRRRLGARAR